MKFKLTIVSLKIQHVKLTLWGPGESNWQFTFLNEFYILHIECKCNITESTYNIWHIATKQ